MDNSNHTQDISAGQKDTKNIILLPGKTQEQTRSHKRGDSRPTDRLHDAIMSLLYLYFCSLLAARIAQCIDVTDVVYCCAFQRAICDFSSFPTSQNIQNVAVLFNIHVLMPPQHYSIYISVIDWSKIASYMDYGLLLCLFRWRQWIFQLFRDTGMS